MNNKSTLLDKIPNEMLRIPEIVHVVTALFNNCFTHGYVPDLWLRSLTPVPKGKGNSPDVPLNYRGISLICLVSVKYIVES